jgi:hypothetical protein
MLLHGLTTPRLSAKHDREYIIVYRHLLETLLMLLRVNDFVFTWIDRFNRLRGSYRECPASLPSAVPILFFAGNALLRIPAPRYRNFIRTFVVVRSPSMDTCQFLSASRCADLVSLPHPWKRPIDSGRTAAPSHEAATTTHHTAMR